MKIAVACEGTEVAQHFGHCEQFSVFEVSDGKVMSKEQVRNPGHRPGFLPVFLHDMGIEVIISGGMGGGAIEIFNEKGIEVCTGASGSAERVAVSFAKGELSSTGSVCHEHAHHDNC